MIPHSTNLPSTAKPRYRLAAALSTNSYGPKTSLKMPEPNRQGLAMLPVFQRTPPPSISTRKGDVCLAAVRRPRRRCRRAYTKSLDGEFRTFFQFIFSSSMPLACRSKRSTPAPKKSTNLSLSSRLTRPLSEQGALRHSLLQTGFRAGEVSSSLDNAGPRAPSRPQLYAISLTPVNIGRVHLRIRRGIYVRVDAAVRGCF